MSAYSIPAIMLDASLTVVSLSFNLWVCSCEYMQGHSGVCVRWGGVMASDSTCREGGGSWVCVGGAPVTCWLWKVRCTGQGKLGLLPSRLPSQAQGSREHSVLFRSNPEVSRSLATEPDAYLSLIHRTRGVAGTQQSPAKPADA